MKSVAILDEETNEAMQPLMERGLAALKKGFLHLPENQRPIGTSSLCIVTEADFVKHTALCLKHVLANNRTLYILCKEETQLCAMLMRHHTHQGGHT